jgi:hypothetical protein
VLADGILLLNFVAAGQSQQIISTSMRMVLTLGLFVCVYKGKVWARILLILFIAIALAHSIVLAVTVNSVLLKLLPAVPTFILYVFTFSPPVKEFLRKQKENSAALLGTPADA